MPWKLTDDRPIYQQLLEELQLRILTGFYGPGQRLPSVRDLAQEASVNPNTMQRALAELEKSGLITTQRTSGRYVTEDLRLIAEERKIMTQAYTASFLQQIQALGYDAEISITKFEEEEEQ